MVAEHQPGATFNLNGGVYVPVWGGERGDGAFPSDTFTLAKESTISTTTTSNVGPGTVYTSPIQVRWKSSDHLYPHPLSTSAKAGIGVGVALVGFIIIGVIAWMFRQRRSSRLKSYIPKMISHKEPSPILENPELPVSNATDITKSSATQVEHWPGAVFSGAGN